MQRSVSRVYNQSTTRRARVPISARAVQGNYSDLGRQPNAPHEYFDQTGKETAGQDPVIKKSEDWVSEVLHLPNLPEPFGMNALSYCAARSYLVRCASDNLVADGEWSGDFDEFSCGVSFDDIHPFCFAGVDADDEGACCGDGDC